MNKLTEHVSILQSRLWDTNTGIVAGPEGILLIDPGIFPEELEAVAETAGTIAAGFATHAHWDHVLWHVELGADTSRYASTHTVAILREEQERILRNLTNMETVVDQGELWDREQLFHEKPMPWGQGSIGGIPVEVLPVPGHADGQAALLLPDHGVCFVADTLSDIEIPSINAGARSIAIYLQTLDRLQGVIDRVDWIIPGHGSPANREQAQQRLDADRRYLEALVPAVHAAGVRDSAEEIAAKLLLDLDEHRAESDLARGMHLDNIAQLIEERDLLNSGLPVRRSSRVILLDTENRVWMLRIKDPHRPRWILPGGGVEEGESIEETARREMWEECGIDDAEIGPMVATREALGSAGEKWQVANEHYFVVRLNGQVPNVLNMLAYEAEDYTGQAWFSADAIRASFEQVYPIGLADLLDLLGRGEYPNEPWRWLD